MTQFVTHMYIAGLIILFLLIGIYIIHTPTQKLNELFTSNYMTNSNYMTSSNPKVAIITANFGSYDIPKSHSNVLNSNLVDWYFWTDNLALGDLLDTKWKVRTKPYHLINMDMIKNKSYFCNILPNPNKQTHNMMSAKFYKICTHHIPELAKYDYWIWIDGSIYLRDGFVNKMLELINSRSKPKLINFAHSVRDNITDEYNLSVQMAKYSTQDLATQYRTYMNSGFEDTQGLYENTIMVKANDLSINKIFDNWWIHNLTYSYQDQLSWPYVLWLYQTKPDYVINLNVFDNDVFSYANYSEMTKH